MMFVLPRQLGSKDSQVSRALCMCSSLVSRAVWSLEDSLYDLSELAFKLSVKSTHSSEP